MAFVDYRSGRGMDGDGRRFSPAIKGTRKTPTLNDVLNTALLARAEWVMLTGKTPTVQPGGAHWLDAATEDWGPGTHRRLESGLTGRFTHKLTGHKLTLTHARAWFDEDITAEQARQAFHAVTVFLRTAEPKMDFPMFTPAATGRMLWGWSVGKDFNPPEIDDFILDRIHATSGQHHMEHLVAGDDLNDHGDVVSLIDPKQTPKIPGFVHLDGRFMYASLARELGVGPARELGRSAAADLLERDPYARARYLVRFRIPDDWQHIGILGCQHENVRDGWYYPNRPGAAGQTWADASEVFVAIRHGWLIEPLEAVQFTKARPLDVFTSRILKIRDQVEAADVPEGLKDAVLGAFRNIHLHGIGALARRNRVTEHRAASIDDVPTHARSTMIDHGDHITYEDRAPLNDREASFYHPEISAQVWGRGRARLLDSPAANGHKAGALYLPGASIIGVEGDAIYTTALPDWARPAGAGGGDDGKVGRFRLKGALDGPTSTPDTREARDRLKKRAAKALREGSGS